MNRKKIFNFIIFIPFAIAIGAFLIYFKYMFSLKGESNITEIMNATLIRYRNIGVFSLAIGVVLLFIKTLYSYFKIEDTTAIRNERVLEKISNKQETETVNYSFNENNIINDLLKGETLIANFYNGKRTEKLVKFKNYNKDKKIIEFYDLSEEETNKVVKEERKVEYVVEKNTNYDRRLFRKCEKCDNIVAKDAVMCVHCGTMFEKKSEKKKSSNPVVFVINLIIVLLCIILFLLCFNAIKKQSKINRSYFNITTVEKLK